MLAGGSARRLGGLDKPTLSVGGRTLLDVALAAVSPARTVVVGRPRDLGSEVLQGREDPPGGGPAAALVAGLQALTAAYEDVNPADLVAVLAADLPGIDAGAVGSLAAAVRRSGTAGAVLTDPDGRSQYLAGVWRILPLLDAAGARTSWQGGRLSDLLGPLIGVRVPADRATCADVDTTVDLLEWGITPPGADQG